MTLRTKLSAGFGLAVALLLAVGAISFRSVLSSEDHSRLVTRADKVLATLESVLLNLSEAESARRGFLITSEERYLENYYSGLSSLAQDLPALRRLIFDPAQQRRLDALTPRIEQRLALLAESIALQRRSHVVGSEQLQKIQRGKELMDQIRSDIDEMKDEELQRLARRAEAAAASARQTEIIIVGGTSLALSVALVGGLLLRREMAIRLRAEDRFRKLLDVAPDSMVIVDQQGRMTLVNGQTELLFGYTRAELLGQPIEQLIPERFRSRHTHHRDNFFAHPPARPMGAGLELFALRKDGSEFPVEISLSPLHTAEGDFVIAAVRDSTHRIQAEAEHIRLMTAIEQASEGVVITDTPGVIQYVNPAVEKMTGYSREEVVGKNPRLFRSGLHERPFYEALWNIILAGRIWRGEITNRRKDGSLYTEEMSITPVRAPQGQITHFISIKQDITERRALEQQLHQAQKCEAIGQLVGGIAHDFNNVIGAILGWSEMGMEQAPPESRLFTYFQKTRAQADRAAALIRQLLAFARRQILEPRNLSLHQTVADVMGMLESILGKNIEVKTVLAPDLAIVRADPTQIEQVLLNLCINARDAMPQGGRLVIETETVEIDDEYCRLHPYSRPGRYVRLTVSDTGTGMDAATIEHIFEPFFTTKEPGRGTGLGLATAFGIVKQHGGFLDVSSELGHGSVFRLYFPTVEGKSEEAFSAVEEAKRGGSETILLAEDHEGVLETARATLESLGYRVLQVSDGAAALVTFRRQPDAIDLALLDVVMPHLNGPEAYALMEVVRPGLPVLFTSGYTAETPAFTEAQKRGLPILPKPYSPSQLARKVRDALDRRFAPASSSSSSSPLSRRAR